MVYSDPVDITGCYSTSPQKPTDIVYLSIRESDHKIIIYTADAPANVLAFGKYETVFKKEKNFICRLKTDSGTIYISIYNKKAQILGLEGKEYTLNKVADVYSLANIEDKSGKYS